MSSFKEQRIRNITSLYYSRPDVQKAIYDFSKNREICPKYFEGYGKRPDSFQYPSDVFEMVKKGATSFHCSEEIWEDPMKIVTGMTEEQANELKIGWDFLVDIDCKYFDYSKKAAEAIIKVFQNHGINNIGIKYSGSKGFHIILPWKAFPKEIAGEKTKNLFPNLPRKILSYVRFKSNPEIKKLLTEKEKNQLLTNEKIKKGIKCDSCHEIANSYDLLTFFCSKCHRQEFRKVVGKDKTKYKCPDCKIFFEIKDSKEVHECLNCGISSQKNSLNFSKYEEVDLFELMGLDLVMVSSRHLFRMPYSLHEKTALASVVLDKEEISQFDLKDADPLKAEVKIFIPESEEGEAEKLVREALDWAKMSQVDENYSLKSSGKYADFKPIQLKVLQDSHFPPCVKKILDGVSDGKKRALFVLINLFRSIGMNQEELEEKIYKWNEKSKPPLKIGYIKSQLSWSYRKKPIMPPNCREFYQGIGVCQPDNLCNTIKNPVNYTIKKNLSDVKSKSKNL